MQRVGRLGRHRYNQMRHGVGQLLWPLLAAVFIACWTSPDNVGAGGAAVWRAAVNLVRPAEPEPLNAKALCTELCDRVYRAASSVVVDGCCDLTALINAGAGAACARICSGYGPTAYIYNKTTTVPLPIPMPKAATAPANAVAAYDTELSCRLHALCGYALPHGCDGVRGGPFFWKVRSCVVPLSLSPSLPPPLLISLFYSLALSPLSLLLLLSCSAPCTGCTDQCRRRQGVPVSARDTLDWVEWK